MAESTTYSVTTKGDIISGFEIDAVIDTFSSIFGVPADKAGSYVQQPKLIKKNLTQKDAETYMDRLVEIGVSVVIKEHTAEGVRAVDNRTTTSANTLDLVPTESETNETTRAPAGFSCPKCQLPQDKSDQCTGCGIFFEKYHAANIATNSTTQNASPTSPNPSPRERVKTRERVIVEEDTFSAAVLVLPVVAAIVGAFVWKLIAVTLNYELGLVAWGIGGLVGTAAAFAGGRGNAVGISCAALALLAIFFGKYMIMAGYQSELTDLFSGEGDYAMLQEVFDEVSADADAFSTISKDDSSIKTFMVSYEYTDAKNSSFITDEELDDFKTYTQPWLEENQNTELGAGTLDSAQLAEFEESLFEMSPVSMVIDDLGLLDILFAFLGISTAFQLGRAGRD